MRKHLLLAVLLMASLPMPGFFTASAEPAPQQQSQTVSTIEGTVYDENNEAVIGATVAVKGTRANAVATDAFGHFIIRVTPGAQLTVTYVGYKSETVAAKNGMTVYLQPTTEQLNELVAIGYGSQKRANLTGAVSTVDVARTMDSRPVTDVTKALQGAVPGLTITNSNGDINGTPKIQIRGTGTLSNGATSNPLIVVDGVVTEDLSFVNPNDIAEISVLKDAASSSIYGTRAAFGVILITTKTPAKKDRVSVKYSNNFGWSQATTLPSYGDVYDQVYALTEANIMAGGEIGIFGMEPNMMLKYAKLWKEQHGGKKADKYREMMPYVDDNNVGDYMIKPNGNGLYYADWDVAAIMFNNAAFSNYHNVSLEGTSGKTQYRLAFGYSDKDDVMAFNPANMKRYNATANISTEIFSWWKAGARISFSEKDYKAPYNTRGDYIYMWRWGSYFGPYGWFRDEQGNQVDAYNDIARRKQGGTIDDKVTETRLTAFMDLNPLKGLDIHADFTYGVTNLLNTTPYMPMYSYYTWGNIAQGPYYTVPVSWADARQTNTKDDMWSMNVYGSYARTFADDFNFKVMLGATAEQETYNYLYGKRDELLDLNLPYLGLTTGGASKTGYEITNTITDRATAGFFGRINFDYKGIYLLELNGRYDGSSRFPANKQWAFFPSGSIGYRFSEENYFKPLKNWWNNGKLRASYGTIGNEAIGSNKFISTIGAASSMSWLTGAGAATPYAPMPTLVSSTLSWERVTTLDLGLDLGFFNNSLTAGFDWFSRTTADMLGPGAELPSVLGANAPYGNNGKVRSTGWELNLGWNHSFGDWDVYATATVADARTKIVSWRNENRKLYSWTPYQSNYTEGEYVGDIWGFETDRYIDSQDFNSDGTPKYDQTALESGSFKYGMGDILFKDLDGNGVINFGNKDMIMLDGKTYIPGDNGYETALADPDHKPVATASQLNHGDLKKIGNAMPRYEYSFRLGAAWKGFDIDMFFQGVGKRNMWMTSSFVIPCARGVDAIYSNQMSYNSYDLDADNLTISNIHVDQNNDYPRLYPGAGARGRESGINQGCYNFYPQDKYLMNMAYLRLKNLTLGYTLPYDITSKALIQKARIYFSADNLALLYNGMHKYPLDPEITTGGNGYESQMSGNGYFGRTTPMQRTFSFGIQVTL